MNWAWAASLDEFWRLPAFPMWLTLAAAGFFGLILVVTLVHAEKSVANGALTVITLLAIGVAVAATIRVYGPTGKGSTSEGRAQPPVVASLAALSCLDDIAGDAVVSACEKALFGSPEAAAAAVTYTAAQVSRLTALGDVAVADTVMTPEMRTLRRGLERDRYGLVAQVLVARDNCTPFDCAAFRSLTDRQQVAANMDSHLYDSLIARYAAGWNAPTVSGALAAPPPSVPTGKPTNADFPSAASTPAVSIMSPEPGSATARQAPPASTATATARPGPAAPRAAAPPAPKKQVAPKPAQPPPAAPVPLTPPAPATSAADDK